MGTVESLECQARWPVFPGGQGQALKGLGRGVMRSELHFRMTNVKVPGSNRAVENGKPTEN